MKRAPLVLAVVGAIGTIVYALVDFPRAAIAWTAAFDFGIATALAALGLAFALQLAHAKWWLVVQRPLIACAGTTPLFALLFVPIALSLRHIYPWARNPGALPAPQQEWNDPRLFVLRAGLYLAIFSALALGLRRGNAQRLAGPGVVILAFAMTFASFDWLMSTEAGFASDMMGVYVLASGLVSATAVFALGAAKAPLAKPDHVHAVGRLLLTSVIFWAYNGFFQLLLLWMANEPREIGFYRARSAGSWAAVDWILVLGRFAVPFLLLLSRPLKRSRRGLSIVGWWLLVTSALEHAWFVLPAAGARLTLWDVAPFLCIGGCAWAYGAHLAVAAPERRAMELGLEYESR